MDIYNKKTFQCVKLENCVKDELFIVETTDGSSVYFYSGTQKGAQAYIDNGFKIKKDEKLVMGSKGESTSFTHTVRGEISYVLIDLDGQDISNVKWKVTRFSPLVKSTETSNLQPSNGNVFVHNALHSKDNDESDTMISYWEKNKKSECKLNLDSFTCPCCGKEVKRDYIDGAHVLLVGKNGQYITPTCKDCNEYKLVTDRYFKVKEADLVLAP
jgi:hypothetical protein